jgi:hypothetical protein
MYSAAYKKHIKGGSKFKYVSLVHFINNGKVNHKYRSCIGKFSAYYNTERESAIAVDKYLIKNGKKPINILKPL